ncbi:MAG: DNA polymerase III subunit delta' [Paracoccaceae bacterium]|nr:MAG: DNA polymerase III subunit delta' [Paracoccaceae bacterium]
MKAAPPPEEEPDRVPGAPHPRETAELYGQAAAADAFLAARAGGRMHHAWLLSGPRGVGKATLAWRIARAVLAGSPTLHMPPDHPVFRRVAALSEPRLALVRRGVNPATGRLRGEITVDEVRRLRDFLQMSAAEGGWRVVIVDAAEEMNPSAANALLKLLEEPPARVLFLLVSHRPGQLLATIRSRCRMLRLGPLGPEDLARALAAAGGGPAGPGLAALAGGSVGEALQLARDEGPALYGEILALIDRLPRIPRPALVAFADSLAGREADARAALARRLVPLALARIARAGVAGAEPDAPPGEAALALRLCPDGAAARIWAEAALSLSGRLDRAHAVNLDPAQAMLDCFLDIEETARYLLPDA